MTEGREGTGEWWGRRGVVCARLTAVDVVQVPEDQRMNAEKKMRQMVLLEESLHNIRMRFNNRCGGRSRPMLSVEQGPRLLLVAS